LDLRGTTSKGRGGEGKGQREGRGGKGKGGKRKGEDQTASISKPL